MLAEVVRRLAKDERRHFAFYYNKARLQLRPRNAQHLTSFIIRHFWLPVGGGVSWILSFILGDSEGEEIAHRIDRTIAKLPGLQWFDRLSRSREEALEEIALSKSINSSRGGSSRSEAVLPKIAKVEV